MQVPEDVARPLSREARWYWNDPERARKKEREKYKRNPAKKIEAARRWQKANPEKVKAYRDQYKVRNESRFRSLRLKTPEINSLLQSKTFCVMCGGDENLEIDHVIPRSRGGTNKVDNLQWLCRPCNAAKGAMTPDEFFAHLQKILNYIKDKV